MKSIIEEASSISKAIENGWLKAGKPQEFSIKIFEEPIKNFFGLSVKSAKIGIFFQETKSSDIKSPENHLEKKLEKNINLEPFQEYTEPTIPVNLEKKVLKSKSNQPIWSQQMVTTINNWLTEIFENIVNKKISFNISQDYFQLNVHIDSVIFDDKNKEKKLFSSLAILIMQMLKKQYKRPFKGYRITFINNL